MHNSYIFYKKIQQTLQKYSRNVSWTLALRQNISDSIFENSFAERHSGMNFFYYYIQNSKSNIPYDGKACKGLVLAFLWCHRIHLHSVKSHAVWNRRLSPIINSRYISNHSPGTEKILYIIFIFIKHKKLQSNKTGLILLIIYQVINALVVT